MDKSNIVNQFSNYVDQLRTQECSQKKKINCFQHIAECILSPAMASHINFAMHCSNATSVLLMFCEDLDSAVRISAEENLNRIFRSLEKTRLKRILMDLYGEIKKNGNQRSLRICLNLFAYYSPHISENHVHYYALHLLPCLQTIAQRKETQLCETLCEFIKSFGKNLQSGITDSETCKLFDVFIGNIGSECAVKRRCSSQNCISLIENSRNKSLMAKHALNKAIDILLNDDHQSTNALLGALGFFRLLLPLIIRDETGSSRPSYHPSCSSTSGAGKNDDTCSSQDAKQIIEIYDFCLHLLDVNHPSNHSVINASLEVINSILQSLNGTDTSAVGKILEYFLCERQQRQHNKFLRRKKSLKNQIFQLKNFQMTCCSGTVVPTSHLNTNPSVIALKATSMEENNYWLPNYIRSLLGDDNTADSCTEVNKHETTIVEKSTENRETTAADAFKLGYEKTLTSSSKRTSEHSPSTPVPPPRRQMRFKVNRGTNITGDGMMRHDVGNATANNTTGAESKECTTRPTGTLSNDELQLKDDKHHECVMDEDEDDSFTALVELNEPLHEDSRLLTSHLEEVVAESGPTVTKNQIVVHIEDGEGKVKETVASGGGALYHFNSWDDLDNESNESFINIDYEPRQKDGGRPISLSTSSSWLKRWSPTTIPTTATTTAMFPTDSNDSGASHQQNVKSSDLFDVYFNNSRLDSSAESIRQPFCSSPESTSVVLATDSIPPLTTIDSPQHRMPRQEDVDNLSLESINSHTSLGSHVSLPGNSSSFRNEPTLVMGLQQDTSGADSGSAKAEVNNDDVLSSVSVTASTALLIGNLNSRNINDGTDDEEKNDRGSPATNKSVQDESNAYTEPWLQLNVGTIYDQAIVYYTSRFVAMKFLLSGQRGGVHSDTAIRVSIKHLCLNVVSNCVRLMPEVLNLSLTISRKEARDIKCMRLAPVISEESEQNSTRCNSSDNISADSNISKEFDQLADHCVIEAENLPLEMKDDHFGRSSLSDALNLPLGRDLDATQLVQSSGGTLTSSATAPKQFEQIRSNSDLVEFMTSRLFVNESTEDKPTSRSKRIGNTSEDVADMADGDDDIQWHHYDKQEQILADVLLFYCHSDPILRGDVQIIIGNFIESAYGFIHSRCVLLNSKNPLPSQQINLLLAILIKGLQDDIHTVVIHALNAFDKIFPIAMTTYLTAAHKKHDVESHLNSRFTCSSNSNQHSPDVTNEKAGTNGRSNIKSDPVVLPYADDDTLIENLLLKHFELDHSGSSGKSTPNEKVNCPATEEEEEKAESTDGQQAQADEVFIISPKLLLNKLRLCYHNKYWLVLNKYAEVISNLDYSAIRVYFGIDRAATYEKVFLSELLQLIGDDDARVRENTAECLCNFIVQVAKSKSKERRTGGQPLSKPGHRTALLEQYQTSLHLLWEFYDYRIFNVMPPPMRELFNEAKIDANLYRYEDVPIVLAKVLYQLTNKLMELNNKNLQCGIIYALKVLLRRFNFLDFSEVWIEFNFTEICFKFAYYNYAVALDLNCQNDLMEILAILIAGNNSYNRFIDNLLAHSMKIINIYYHLFTNKNPLLFAKAQKNDLFANAKEVAIVSSVGYFGSDFVYLKLYNILKSAYDSYKMTINQISGAKLISLLQTCINTLSTCIELKVNCGDSSPSGSTIKLIEEIIQYLSKLINYAPIECITSLRQLLKFLFGRNFGTRYTDYQRFINPYLVAKSKSYVDNRSKSEELSHQGPDESLNSASVIGQLFAIGLEFPLSKADWENDFVKHIKLFEPLVIHCLTLFMSSNGRIQASILELFTQLLELNVTYTMLDPKYVIFKEILANLDLVESGNARNGKILIPSVLRFLVQLTYKSDRQMITIPKIISITNNLLANNSILECSVLALKGLALEIFMMPITLLHTINAHPTNTTTASPSALQERSKIDPKELETQKEVVLGMLQKFIDSPECQRILAILLLQDQSWRSIVPILKTSGKEGEKERADLSSRPLVTSPLPSPTLSFQEGTIYKSVAKGLCDNTIKVHDWQGFFIVKSLLENNSKHNVEFLPMLTLIFRKSIQSIQSFGDLAVVVIILESVIPNVDEIFLKSNIQLCIKGDEDDSASNSSTDESLKSKVCSESSALHNDLGAITRFIEVLLQKLEYCLSFLKMHTQPNKDYCKLVVRFVKTIRAVWEKASNKRKQELLKEPLKIPCQIENHVESLWHSYQSVDPELQLQMMKLSFAISRHISRFTRCVINQLVVDWIQINVLKEILSTLSPAHIESSDDMFYMLERFSNYLLTENMPFVRYFYQRSRGSKLAALYDSPHDKNSIRWLITAVYEVWDTDLKSYSLLYLPMIMRLYNKSLKYMNRRLERQMVTYIDKLTEEFIEDEIEVELMPLLSNAIPNDLNVHVMKRFSSSLRDLERHTRLMLELSENAYPMGLSQALIAVGKHHQRSIFSVARSRLKHILPSAIDVTLKRMLLFFRQRCVTGRPAINNLHRNDPYELFKVSLETLREHIENYQFDNIYTDSSIYLATSTISLLVNVRDIENAALIYIDSKVIEKYLQDIILTSDTMKTMKKMLRICCSSIKKLFLFQKWNEKLLDFSTYVRCIDELLRQRYMWSILNQCSNEGEESSREDIDLLNDVLNTLFIAMSLAVDYSIFYKKFKIHVSQQDLSENATSIFKKAIFLAKLIEIGYEDAPDNCLRTTQITNATMVLRYLKSIGISILRMNHFYACAVTPLEIYQQSSGTDDNSYEDQIKSSNGKLPSISVEHLSDVDVLQKFVKRLSIFGFTTRKQFEEYFMTFLLLINKVYDENMVDVQEQFQIKSICLDAILELLIMCRTFPIGGGYKLSHFYHTTRWARLSCKEQRLQQLHHAQLYTGSVSLFYHPNLERNLLPKDDGKFNMMDNVIGTCSFTPNQYDLNFIWQQMDAYNNLNSQSIGSTGGDGAHSPSSATSSTTSVKHPISGEDVVVRNFRRSLEVSGIDLRSSSQLIFDVLMQINEQNHILVLPNLVKFVEICDSRSQIKLIKDKVMKLQEAISMDDAISHQYIIYLLCKTQAILIPSLNELSHLCNLAAIYLKSSHIFIRNATLSGLLCLLECCSKTNTKIGKRSDELVMLTDLITGYVNSHGITLDDSASVPHYSDTHTKLIWILQFSLVEWTSKFSTSCNLLLDTIPPALKLINTTNSEDIYLCVIHALERMVVTIPLGLEVLDSIEAQAIAIIKFKSERFSIPALRLLLSCIYIRCDVDRSIGHPILMYESDQHYYGQKVTFLLHCIRVSNGSNAWIYGQVLCQILKDLSPPQMVLMDMIKEILSPLQLNSDVIANVVHQVFDIAKQNRFIEELRSCIIFSMPTILGLPEHLAVWVMVVLFVSASDQTEFVELYPLTLSEFKELNSNNIYLFKIATSNYYSRLSPPQKRCFREMMRLVKGKHIESTFQEVLEMHR